MNNKQGLALRSLHRHFIFFLLLAGLTLASASRADTFRLEQTNASVLYDGAWQTIQGDVASGGNVAASATAGASVTVTFEGTGIAWIGYRCPCAAGIARVYLDGELHATVNTYGTGHEPQQVVYRVSGLARAAHTLTIEVTGERDPRGQGAHVVIDAFDVESAEAVQVVEEDNYAITYTGEWIEVRDPSLSGGRVVASRQAGATATITFTGTGIEWIGYRCPCAAGVARVAFDGSSLGTLNTYSTNREAQASIYRFTGHGYREHTFRIEVTGDSAGDNAYIVLDAFRVLGGDAGDPLPSDPTPPTVALTAPAPSAVVTGSVTLSAEASDNVGVTRVDFLVNGPNGEILIGQDRTAPYSFTRDVSTVASGSYFWLTARAYDAAGNVASDSHHVHVHHGDDALLVNITSPAYGSTVSGTIRVTADVRGAPPEAELSVRYGGTVVGPPYELLIDTTQFLDGWQQLGATLMPRNTLSSFASDSIRVMVDNRIQPHFTRVDDAEAGIVYAGTWNTFSGFPDTSARDRAFHWDSIHQSSAPGATATYTFEGTGVVWLGARCETCGRATVSIDGSVDRVVDLEGSRGLTYYGTESVYRSPPLAYGTHTIQIRVEDNQGDNLVAVDGFMAMKTVAAMTDTTLPSLQLDGQRGATLTGTVALNATASDASGIAKVQFYGNVLIGEDTTAPYSVNWDTRLAPNGDYYVYAVAIDNAGNRSLAFTEEQTSGTVASYLVNVWNGAGPAPYVNITAPAPGATVSGTVTVAADIFHPEGVRSMAFHFRNASGQVTTFVDNTAPYAMTLDTNLAPDGVYTMYVSVNAGSAERYYGNFHSTSRQVSIDND